MKVLTLSPDLFQEAAECLEERVARDFAPDLVVSIAAGGVHVARRMFGEVGHISVICRRPSTGRKDRSKRTFQVIRRLPLWARNAMRLAEAGLLKRGGAKERRVIVARDNEPLVSGARRILVVDDAVDSGESLAAVLAALKALSPEAQIRSAAITVTTASPVASPDYSIYSRILVRFPWSKDYR